MISSLRAISAMLPVQPVTGLLPAWLDPSIFLNNPRLGPWIIILVCVIVFAETGLLIGFFLPGDSLLFTAGLFVATGVLHVNLWVLTLCIFIAAVAGDQVGYYIGRKAGPAIFNRPDSRLFRREHVDKAHTFFDKHGGKAVLLARFVPIVRTFTPVVAGTAKMPYRTFVLFNVIGALLWGVGVTLLGYFLGGRFPWVGKNIDLIFILVVVLSVLPMLVEVLRKTRKRKTNATEK